MEQVIPEVNWMDLIIAFMHDPTDKVLDIRGHESRAQKYLQAAIRSLVERKQIKVLADIDASVAERLPMPTAGPEGARAVGPENGTLMVIHPLSGDQYSLRVGKSGEETVVKCISNLTAGIDEPQRLFFALWRLLPDRLGGIDKMYLRLPADSRVPDHTIWNHLDTTAALAIAEHGGGLAFLSFALGPVQEFIAASRSVRDLWSGSMVLSWITFQAMIPVVEKCGPTALIYPSLRSLPWVDSLLREKFGLKQLIAEPEETARRVPSLPNRFLAVVPGGVADQLAERCKEAGRNAWKSIADKVHFMIDEKFSALPGGQGWSKRWDDQVQSYFSFSTSVIRRRDCGHENIEDLLSKKIAAEARSMADVIPKDHRPSYEQKSAGSWQAIVEYSARLMEAQRTVRHVPVATSLSSGEMVPKKCSLLGSFEQMGPDELSQSNDFWTAANALPFGGVRIRPSERLCAVSLVKRFSEPAFMRSELKLGRKSFGDTATVAARLWLKRANIDPEQYEEWNGQWLHWPKKQSGSGEASIPDMLWSKLQEIQNSEGIVPVPSYYAILMMDGDQMGNWLNGEKAPKIRDIMHPKILSYFERLGSESKLALEGKRPVGPAMHAAISQALTNFAVYAVPQLVEKHKGTLIYSGGDDVLALLPLETALQCALELYQAFRGEIEDGSEEGYFRLGGRDYLAMGRKATLSGGLVLVHYKADLRRSLDEARAAEKDAKRAGRDVLMIKACRRSGEHSSLLCAWNFLMKMHFLEKAFSQGASDRFAYHLAGEQRTLEGLDSAAQLAEIKRQISRAEPSTRKMLTGSEDSSQAGDFLAGLFQDYAKSVHDKHRKSTGIFSEFICMLQTASFLARGRD